MNVVYIVTEETDMECHDISAHSTYAGALAVVEDLIEYAGGMTKVNEWTWESENYEQYVFIQEMKIVD
jgi:hypothetical protein